MNGWWFGSSNDSTAITIGHHRRTRLGGRWLFLHSQRGSVFWASPIEDGRMRLHPETLAFRRRRWKPTLVRWFRGSCQSFRVVWLEGFTFAMKIENPFTSLLSSKGISNANPSWNTKLRQNFQLCHCEHWRNHVEIGHTTSEATSRSIKLFVMSKIG